MRGSHVASHSLVASRFVDGNGDNEGEGEGHNEGDNYTHTNRDGDGQHLASSCNAFASLDVHTPSVMARFASIPTGFNPAITIILHASCRGVM